MTAEAVVVAPRQVSYCEYRLEFPGEPESLFVIRASIRAMCTSWSIAQDEADTTVLLACEVATNSIAVSRGEVLRLTVRRVLDYLYFDCSDRSHAIPETPPMPDAEELELSGRGLALVEELASSCGWMPMADEQGKIRWFTLAAR